MPKISVAVIQRVFDLLRHFDGRRYPVAQALRLRLLLTGHCTHEKPYRKFVQLSRSVIRKTRRLLKSYCYNIGVTATAKDFTFFSHAHFEAFFEATMLTLVAMVLVDRAIPGSATLVR